MGLRGTSHITLISHARINICRKEEDGMKDSATLLNFNVNRELTFPVCRKVDFQDARGLSFDHNRELGFSQNRDLGFGKRGVVFRGYVCPVCKAPVARDAPQCDECGTAFKQQPQPKQQKKAPTWERVDPDKEEPVAGKQAVPPRKEVPPGKVRETFVCPVCEKILYVGVESCPGCHTRFASPGNVPPPNTIKIAQGTVNCANCNYTIPPADRFCRRCGSPRPDSWQSDPSLDRRM